MSLRKDLRDALITAIKALALVDDDNVAAWQGAMEEFNSTGAFPSIEVGNLKKNPSVIFGEPIEVGARTYEREFRFAVYVSTEDEDGGTTAETLADETAATILEGLEEGLQETDLTVDSKNYRLELAPGPMGAEMLLDRRDKASLHVQQYRIIDLNSI